MPPGDVCHQHTIPSTDIHLVAALRTLADFQSGAVSTSGVEVPSWSTNVLLPLGFGLLTLRLALDARDAGAQTSRI